MRFPGVLGATYYIVSILVLEQYSINMHLQSLDTDAYLSGMV
jgi:hypothetical protein